jgi:hypothetical protein
LVASALVKPAISAIALIKSFLFTIVPLQTGIAVRKCIGTERSLVSSPFPVKEKTAKNGGFPQKMQR